MNEMDVTNTGNEPSVRVEIRVDGDVQEGGYRSSVMKIAKRHGVKGYVGNLPDGSVKVIAEAPEAILKQFIESLDIRNGVIEVEKIDVVFGKATGEFKWFDVKFTDLASEIYHGFTECFGRMRMNHWM